LVPVLLGPTLPRADRGEEERAQWCRTMLILFKPWRTLNDILPSQRSWTEAFEEYRFDSRLEEIMSHIGVLNQCRDAR
ncbi:hypothetical protein CALCODRAFT_423227, partial [Calocera cornea HHB12733]